MWRSGTTHNCLLFQRPHGGRADRAGDPRLPVALEPEGHRGTVAEVPYEGAELNPAHWECVVSMVRQSAAFVPSRVAVVSCASRGSEVLI